MTKKEASRAVRACARAVTGLRNRFVSVRVRELLLMVWLLSLGSWAVPAEPTLVGTCRVRITVDTPLSLSNVPLDPVIDFADLIARGGLRGVLDPNSIAVYNVANRQLVPHATTAVLSPVDCRRLEFVINDPQHSRFDLEFSVFDRRPSPKPLRYTPPIGVGDLLRYNAGRPKPITLLYSIGLHDLNNDGRQDLAGTWNYAHRPGTPWDGIVCYPRVGEPTNFDFSGLHRLSHFETSGKRSAEEFSHTYMAVDFADFNSDEILDLVVTRRGSGAAEIYIGSDSHDSAGLPVFRSDARVEVAGWMACRAVDLNRDGVTDLVVDGTYIKNTNRFGWPFRGAEPVSLNAGRQPCFLDLDGDHRPDAVCLHGSKTLQPDFYRVAWRKNLGGDPPRFGDEQILPDITSPLCSLVSAYQANDQTGLIVQHNAFQEISFYALTGHRDGSPRLTRQGRAESLTAVMSLSDQAWPCLCDWDGDGDSDLLVGGGYGWPRIVINQGDPKRPSFAEPRKIMAAGKPIRFVRNRILGQPFSSHDMGYPYPTLVDWDADKLPDLVFANETNRIFWHKNVGTRQEPKFGLRRQLICDGYPDSSRQRQLSAERAIAPNSADGVYPREKERPFYWRTGAAFADFNGDGLTDLVTHDGWKRNANLFVQYRRPDGELRLRRERELRLTDGRPLNDMMVSRAAHWTESFRAADWDEDGRIDLFYSVAGAHQGTAENGSIYLLRNVGTRSDPQFAPPQTMRCFGEPIRITNHGPHPWPGDFDDDGQIDLIACVEWSVYPFFSHAALKMHERPKTTITLLQVTQNGETHDDSGSTRSD